MSDIFDEKSVAPMLLHENAEPFDSYEYIFELKFDGIRCIAYLDGDSVSLFTRHGNDITRLFPELKNIGRCVSGKCILDGELITTKNGKPDFHSVRKRILMNGGRSTDYYARNNPAELVVFDILYLNGRKLNTLPLTERKRLLAETVTECDGLVLSRYIEKQGKALFRLTQEQNIEGIVAKKKDSVYSFGKRSHEWIKIKNIINEEVFICGYIPAPDGGVRELILASDDGGKLVCRGSVLHGVTKEDRQLVEEYALTHKAAPWFNKYRKAIWFERGLRGNVQYMKNNDGGAMREAVFRGIILA